MPAEITRQEEFEHDLDSIKQSLNTLAEAVGQLYTYQQVNLDGCCRMITELAKSLSEYQEVYLKNISINLESFVKSLEAFAVLNTERPEDTTGIEDAAIDIINASPLEEKQKNELRCNVEEKMKSGDNWERKNYILAVIALIISTILGILQTAAAGGDSGTTVNISSPTIVIDDAEAAEAYIAQISELLDELREE